jgi:hypothetical protein
VAIRALEDGVRPQVAKPLDRQQLVDHPGAEQHAARLHDRAAERHLKSAAVALD